MRCLGCDYLLYGLSENRCPECGRPFDPSDPHTFNTKIWVGRRYLALSLLGIAAMSLPLLFAYWRDGHPSGSFPGMISLALLLCCLFGGWALEIHVMQISYRALFREAHRLRQRSAMTAAFVMGSLVAIGGPAYLVIDLLARQST